MLARVRQRATFPKLSRVDSVFANLRILVRYTNLYACAVVHSILDLDPTGLALGYLLNVAQGYPFSVLSLHSGILTLQTETNQTRTARHATISTNAHQQKHQPAAIHFQLTCAIRVSYYTEYTLQCEDLLHFVFTTHSN